jgi:hypothetical protein
MRRCGRASCLVLVGLLAAATAAGGAYPAAGGHQGNGHAWAYGHDKHAAATPQLAQPQVPKPQHGQSSARKSKSPSAPVTRADERASAAHEKSAPSGAGTRHNHRTICHRTGSGRYIVISPNVNGAMHGHLSHHDDLVYVDGCGTAEDKRQPEPKPEPGSVPSPKAPAEGSGVSTLASEHAAELPFTGFPASWLVLGGALTALAGAALRFRPSRAGRFFLTFRHKSRI